MSRSIRTVEVRVPSERDTRRGARPAAFALDLARQANGRVTLMHALEWPSEDIPRTSMRFDTDAFRESLAEDVTQRLHLQRRSSSEHAVAIG